MTSQEVLSERERIKAIINKKFDAVIEYRKKRIKHRNKGTSDFERLRDNIFFLIDNPDYVRKIKEENQEPES
jgi:hypothetical protein